MKALRFYAFADNLQNLSVEQMSDLPVHPGEAKIKIVAACVNPSDVKNAQGHIPATTLRRTPGRDFAGIVIDGPENLLNTQVWGSGGDIGFIRDGSHAEFLVIPAEAVSPKPRNLSFEQASCVGVNFLTAYQGLFRCANLKQGETLLVMARKVVSAPRPCNSGKHTVPSLSASTASPFRQVSSTGSI